MTRVINKCILYVEILRRKNQLLFNPTKENKMDAHQKLMGARCKLLMIHPFYGHMAMAINWIESPMADRPENQRTMGVRVLRGGRIECVWYKPFVDKLSFEEVFGVIQHEIEHLIRLHCVRIGGKIPHVWNIACDAAVNGTKENPRIGHQGKTSAMIVPLDGNIIWIPKGWPTDETADYYYERLMQDAEVVDNPSPSGMIDDHDIWGTSDMSKEEVRQIVNGLASQAASRAAGNIPGHLASILEKLATPIVSWSQILNKYLGQHLGNRRKTYSRRNRRIDEFGSIGISHRAAAKASVVVDTSGSISDSDLSQFFSEIEAISNRTKVCLLQWDHAFQGFDPRYRRGDWKRIKINGRGGTDMAAPVEWLYERGLVGDVCIMLTDGYCNYTDPKPFPMITCLTTGDGEKPSWGTTVSLNEHLKRE